MLPAGLVAGGVLALLFGAFVGILPLVTLGLISMLLGGLSFMAAPIIAVGMAARSERRRRGVQRGALSGRHAKLPG